MTKKALLKRLESLEEYLGVAFTADEYPEHITEEYGKMQRINKLLDVKK